MGRIPAAEVSIPVDAPGNGSGGGTGSGDLRFPSSRSAGAAVKRYTHADPAPAADSADAAPALRPTPDRRGRGRSYGGGLRAGPARKGGMVSGAEVCFYCGVSGVVVLLVLSFVMPQRLMRVGQGVSPWGLDSGRRGSKGGRGVGEVLRFVPVDLLKRLEERGRMIDRARSERVYGIRPPKLGIVLGTMAVDPYSLMLLTIAKSLRTLGYALTVYAVNEGKAHLLWEKIGCQVTYLSFENTSSVDWSIFNGIIFSSLEAKVVISSLVPEPFRSIPVIWIVHEDILSKRVPLYIDKGWHNLIFDWHNAFSRADAVVFPDFWLPMMYSTLDSGNFLVIPGSPADAWAVDIYTKTHLKDQLRKDIGFNENDIIVLVTGSSLFFDELPWDFTAIMHVIGPQLWKSSQTISLENSFKFVFLCGNSSHGHDSAFQEIAAHLGFPRGSVLHYSFNEDVNKVLMGADIVLYASFQDEQSFPPILTRAMSFGIPILVPDLPIIKIYVVDKVNGLLYHAQNIDTLTKAFSALISDTGLSELALAIGTYGKIMSKNMFASDCLTEYAKLLEKVVHFPSDAILPRPISELQQHSWDWNLFETDVENIVHETVSEKAAEIGVPVQTSGIVFSLENEFAVRYDAENASGNTTDVSEEDYPTELDWNEIGDIELLEDYERRETEELEDRTERTLGSWEHIYNTARKSEKKKFEVNERDEGELERIGRPLCIYEIYDGEAAWPFLHHGAIYRGVSLSRSLKRLRLDDIDAVQRLPLLHDKFYKDILCEVGGMFSIANKVDDIHKIPWIGFQSWRTVGKKVSLSSEAEKVLERTISEQTKGDVIYFWAKVGLEGEDGKEVDNSDFWSICDIINDGTCRKVFKDTFRSMYSLPVGTPALPPMPANGYWSMLHSWVMPTPSFLEFIMFSRMFVDSLDSLNYNTSENFTCLLGSSTLESRHCYCRVLELLVNVWAYHSARRMVYINPVTGELSEQHSLEHRTGQMWVRYFNFTLLKSMDEDLAEEADDGFPKKEKWLWPLTGEVHWQGIFERERDEKYRKKMDKHKKTMEKLIERQKYGYRQKALGG